MEDANRVEVVGRLRDARFPELCARCGAESGLRTLPVLKLFWHDGGEGPSYHTTEGVDAPFCAECIRAHQRELPPVDPAVRRRLLRSWLVQSLPYVLPLGVSLWLLGVLGPNLLRALAGFRRDDPWEAVIWGAVCGFFGLLALVFLRIIRNLGRQLVLEPAGARPAYVRVERGPLGSRSTLPVEPTSAMRAVDFSGDRSELFEGERHLFTFQNGEVAARFAELNAGREWDPASSRAVWARTARWVLFGTLALAALYLLVAEYLH